MKKNIILTSYYTKKKDPQRGIYSACCYDNMAKWYESVLRNNLDAVVIHDVLDEQLISRCERDSKGKVTFVYYKPIEGLSGNDERFVHFWDYLKHNPVSHMVLITDLFDVEILKSPFEDAFIEYGKIYLGSYGTWADLPILRLKYPAICGEDFDDVPRYNPGTICAYYKPMMDFIYDMKSIILFSKGCESNINLGLTAFLAKKIENDVTTGKPFVTSFRANEYDTNCYIKHK